MVLRSVRNGRSFGRGVTAGLTIPTTERSVRITRASVVSCRRKPAKGWPNKGEASATRTTGARQAMKPAQRCRQCVRVGQCRRVGVAPTPDITPIGVSGKTPVATALKIRHAKPHGDCRPKLSARRRGFLGVASGMYDVQSSCCSASLSPIGGPGPRGWGRCRPRRCGVATSGPGLPSSAATAR